MKNSRLRGFYHFSTKERLQEVARWADLSKGEEEILFSHSGFCTKQANHMIENVIGIFPMPLAIAPNFKINNKDYLVPMVTEEASVVAAASNGARYLRHGEGIQSEYSSSIMIGQVQLLDVPDLEQAKKNVLSQEKELIQKINRLDSMIVRKGGGVKKIEVRIFDEAKPFFMVVHIHMDVLDAMGANAINTMCEKLAPHLEKLTKGRAGLKILSNKSHQRVVKCCGRAHLGDLHKDPKKATTIAQGIEDASIFAERDSYRAVTHNKGILNGIDAVLLATGQDHRAVEAMIHSYASKSGKYSALATWRFRKKQRILEGRMEIPIAVGTVGGITRVHPTVQVAQKILNVHSAGELSEVIASVGLTQNLAALMALSTEGIQRGHMGLHSRNIAFSVGARGEEIARVAQILIENNTVETHNAREVLFELRQQKATEIARSAGAKGKEVEEVARTLLNRGILKTKEALEVLDNIRRTGNGTGFWKSRK